MGTNWMFGVEPPSIDLENTMTTAEEVLSLFKKDTAITDKINMLGIGSMTSLILVANINRRFPGTGMSVLDLFSAETVQDLVARIDESQQGINPDEFNAMQMEKSSSYVDHVAEHLNADAGACGSEAAVQMSLQSTTSASFVRSASFGTTNSFDETPRSPSALRQQLQRTHSLPSSFFEDDSSMSINSSFDEPPYSPSSYNPLQGTHSSGMSINSSVDEPPHSPSTYNALQRTHSSPSKFFEAELRPPALSLGDPLHSPPHSPPHSPASVSQYLQRTHSLPSTLSTLFEEESIMPINGTDNNPQETSSRSRRGLKIEHTMNDMQCDTMVENNPLDSLDRL